MIGYILKNDEISKVQVTEFVGYDKSRKNKYYKVICSLCSKDPELFYKDFILSGSNIKNGRIPCGCSRCPNWDETQTKLLVKRKSVDKFLVGVYDNYVGQNTRVELTCCNCNHKWKPVISSILSGKGCNKCARKQSSIDRKNKKADDDLIRYLTDKGYTFNGWEFGEYENTFSKFEFECPTHGVKQGTYNNIFNHNRGCPDCSERGGGFDRSRDMSYLYVVEWTNDKGESWIKYGITYDINVRMNQIKKANINKNNRNISSKVLYVFSGTGVEVSTTESEIKKLVGESNVPQSEMYSGFTECTKLDNLHKIISKISETDLHNQSSMIL